MFDDPERPFERCDDCGTPKMLGRTYCITCGKRYSKMRPTRTEPIAPSQVWPAGAEPIAPPEAGPVPRPDLFPPPSPPLETPNAGPPDHRPAAAMAVAIVLTLALIAAGLVFAFRPATKRSASTPSESANPSPLGPPILLSLAFDRRKPFRFHLANTIDATFTVPSEGFARIIMKIDERATLRVLSVDRYGTTRVQMTIERASASVNGRGLRIPPGKSLQLRIARDGRILSTGGAQVAAAGASNGGIPSIDQFMPLLPPDPVKPGDSWARNFSLPFPFGGGTLRYRTQNRFIRYGELAGVRAALIRSQIDVPIRLAIDARRFFEATGGDPSKLPPEAQGTLHYQGRMSADQESWFDPAARRALRTTSHGDMDIHMKVSGSQGGQASEIRFQGTFDTVFENLT